MGTICYLVLHTLLYSEKFTSYKLIEKYRSYIYYLMAGDFLIMNLHRAIFIKDHNLPQHTINQNQNHESEDEQEENDEESEGDEESNEKKNTRGQIIKKNSEKQKSFKDAPQNVNNKDQYSERVDNNEEEEENSFEEIDNELSDTTIMKYEQL
jgi:hypothetical protein